MIAIIITIMVLEMKVPQGEDLAALRPLIPVLLSYVLSLAFWLSLVPSVATLGSVSPLASTPPLFHWPS